MRLLPQVCWRNISHRVGRTTGKCPRQRIADQIANRQATAGAPEMLPLELVKLKALMERHHGSPDVTIGLIDGPVAPQHGDLASQPLCEIRGRGVSCTEANDVGVSHGTFVAGILSAKRSSQAPAICPGCTVVICAIFTATTSARELIPTATSTDLAAAIVACVDAGVRIINLSLEWLTLPTREAKPLEEALNQAMRHSTIVVAAAGIRAGSEVPLSQVILGSSPSWLATAGVDQ